MREWALSICSTGIALALLQMLIPKTKLKSAVGMVLSLVFLLAVLSPLAGLKGQLSGLAAPAVDPELLEQQADDLALAAMRYTLADDIQRILDQIGIKAMGVRIDIEVTGSTYNLKGVALKLNEADRASQDAITALLKAEMGQAVEISYVEEDA
jgi:hypothetical protein